MVAAGGGRGASSAALESGRPRAVTGLPPFPPPQTTLPSMPGGSPFRLVSRGACREGCARPIPAGAVHAGGGERSAGAVHAGKAVPGPAGGRGACWGLWKALAGAVPQGPPVRVSVYPPPTPAKAAERHGSADPML